jgi:hypothetical protein
VLSAASTAAIDTTPTLTIRLKHPERTKLLSDPPRLRQPPNYIPPNAQRWPRKCFLDPLADLVSVYRSKSAKRTGA